MFYIYILKSKQNGSYYIGSCQNIDKRLDLHNRGLVKSTKRYSPWKIIYSEQYKDFKSAHQRELKIKAWKKRSVIERIINNSKF